MTTCRDIISDALRMAKVIGIAATPTASEASLGLRMLQSYYDQLVANGAFGRLQDVYLDENATAEEGKRYYLSGATLTYPTTIEDECSGEARQPYDLSLVESFNGTARTVKLYDRTAWVDLLGLGLDTEAPLSGRGSMGLAACLARAYCEAFGGELGIEAQRLARNFEGALAAKSGTTQPKQHAEYF